MAWDSNYDVSSPSNTARGKALTFSKHALQEMANERPRVRERDIERVLEEPTHDDGTTAWKRQGKRTIIVRYEEDEAEIHVKTASATRRRLRS